MKEFQYSLVLKVFLLLLHVTNYCHAQEDWECVSPCKCKWISGKKTAECIRRNFNQIPDMLSSEIQNLDLTGNQIRRLHEAAFEQVHLVNLHIVTLRECDIEKIHKKAFKGLNIVIEMDLSVNKIKHLHAGVFSEMQRLRLLLLNQNDLQSVENGLFDGLSYLQKIVLSDNQIEWIGEESFQNLPNLRTLALDGNKLNNVKLSTFEMLPRLGSLELHNNPWNCDCHLKKIRDWTIERKLYKRTTTCKHPLHLSGKMWSEVSSNEFACQPGIKTISPNTKIVQVQYGSDAKLNCLAVGIPKPRVHWVFGSRILNNSTTTRRRHSSAGEKVDYFLTESIGDGGDWVNLTIPDITAADKGEYSCVAQSPGGFAEENVNLVVVGDVFGGGIGIGKGEGGNSHVISLPLALGLAVAFLLLLFVALTLIVFYCRRKHTTLYDEKSQREIDGSLHHQHGALEQHGLVEQEKSLIAAINSPSARTGATTAVIVKPSRRYDTPSVTSHGTEMTELNRTLLDNDSVFADGIGVNSRNNNNDDEEEEEDEERRRITPDLESGTLYRGTNTNLNSSVGSSNNNRQYPPDLLAFPGGRGGSSPTSQASTAPDNSRLFNQHLFGSPPSQPYASGGGFKTLPHNRSGTPYYSIVSAGNGSGTNIPILPRQGYVTIPRRPRAPSWSCGPPTTSPVEIGSVEPVYDNLGVRHTADGSSVTSLNKSPEPSSGSVRSGAAGRPLPNLPPNSSTQQSPSNILMSTNANNNNNSNKSSPLDRSAPEGAAEWPLQLPDEVENSQLQQQQQQPTVGSLGRKVPPRPPPKPRKKNANGPLYEDEGEDGTEV